MRASLLTGGQDPHYAVGLARALADHGVTLDVIGSDELEDAGFDYPGIRFLNLRGSASGQGSAARKALTLCMCYARLLLYAATSPNVVFHILWNTRIEWFDRTFLMFAYRLFGHRVLITAHNVNAARRDGADGWLNRLTLRIQYHLCDGIFVHTPRMSEELQSDFGVPRDRILEITYAVNDVVPRRHVTRDFARESLGLKPSDRVLLFFGNIAPYKGLDQLVQTLKDLTERSRDYHLLVAGQPKRFGSSYWQDIKRYIETASLDDHVSLHIKHIPDHEIEVYFVAADLLVLPYVEIFQSGVLFLGYRFGVPVVATDVGSLRESVIDGVTGYVCAKGDRGALTAAIERFFAGPIFAAGGVARDVIAKRFEECHSWSQAAATIVETYSKAGRP